MRSRATSILVALTCFIGATRTVSAEEAARVDLTAPWASSRAAPPRSRTTALAVPLVASLGVLVASGVATMVGVAEKAPRLIVGGMLAGEVGLVAAPSLGQLYSGEPRALPFMLGRSALFAAANLALSSYLLDGLGSGSAQCIDCAGHDSDPAMLGVGAVCLTAGVALAALEIALSPAAADRYNRRQQGDEAALHVAPTLLFVRSGEGEGRMGPGIAAQVRF